MKKEPLQKGKSFKEYGTKVEVRSLLDGGLSKCLWEFASNPYNAAFNELWNRLTKLCGKSPAALKTPAEFWTPKLKSAVTFIVGKKWQRDMEEMTELMMAEQFSASPLRRSYRSAFFGYHAVDAVYSLGRWIRWTSYDKTPAEMLYYKEQDNVGGSERIFALACRRNDNAFVSLMKEAILGDNSQLLLSPSMIKAIIISGHDELLELSMKLLAAAKLQEGLRQQILESADAGNVETLSRILKLCVDEDMFRYSTSMFRRR